MNLSTIPLLLALTLPLTSEAVQTRFCPETLEASFSKVQVLSAAEVRSHERHARYSEAMMTEALNSRERAEKHLTETFPPVQLSLKKRENGRCIYQQEIAPASPASAPASGADQSAFLSGLNSRRVTLYTKAGKDLYREEFTLPYRRRDSETFVIESELQSYSIEGIRLGQNQGAELRVLVNYPCYDDHCHTEARMGWVDQSAR